MIFLILNRCRYCNGILKNLASSTFKPELCVNRGLEENNTEKPEKKPEATFINGIRLWNPRTFRLFLFRVFLSIVNTLLSDTFQQ